MDPRVSTIPGLQYLVQWAKSLLINILKTGPAPQHIAIVMDGNRRYARQRKKEVQEGHSKGFEALASTLETCYNAGVKVVTVFAFSIENFSRTPYEVDALMEMAKTRLTQLCENGDLCDQYGISIRILGNRNKIPDDVKKVVEQAEERTGANTRATLNVCFPYTSRDEITASIQSLVTQAKAGYIEPNEIDEEMIDKNMYTAGCPPLDIMIRSSGVTRFSDFLLWQAHKDTAIEFVSTLWPEFGFWDIYMIMMRWSLKKATQAERIEEEELEEDKKSK